MLGMLIFPNLGEEVSLVGSGGVRQVANELLQAVYV